MPEPTMAEDCGISDVRYAPLSATDENAILFTVKGKPHRGVLRGRNGDLCLGAGEAQDKAIALRVYLNGDAEPYEPKIYRCIRCKRELNAQNSMGRVHCHACYNAAGRQSKEPVKPAQSIESQISGVLSPDPFKPGGW